MHSFDIDANRQRGDRLTCCLNLENKEMKTQEKYTTILNDTM